MEDLLNQLKEISNLLIYRDFWDYIEIIAPLGLSVVAIIISLWSAVWSEKKKKLEAFIVWDDLYEKFFVIIKNSGKKSIIIDSVKLFSYDKKSKTQYELGTRENVWVLGDNTFISPNEALKYEPTLGSIYDIFAFKGHYFDVTREMENLKVKMKVLDIERNAWVFKTRYTLGEINDKV